MICYHTHLLVKCKKNELSFYYLNFSSRIPFPYEFKFGVGARLSTFMGEDPWTALFIAIIIYPTGGVSDFLILLISYSAWEPALIFLKLFSFYKFYIEAVRYLS